MKKLLIFGIATLALASCKKDYTCECVHTSADNGGANDPYTSTVVLEGVTKKTVSNAYDCISYEGTTVYSNGDVSTYKTECTVSKL